MLRTAANTILCFVIVLGVFLSNDLFAQDDSLPRIEIQPDEVELSVGDSVQLSAIYFDTSGTSIDTTVNWSVHPMHLGTFADEGLFVGIDGGSGFIVATFGDLTDTAEVEINSEDDPPGDDSLPELIIIPHELELAVGDSVDMHVMYVDTNGTEMDTTADWSVYPDSIGSITNTGLFTASLEGQGFIIATLDTLSDSVEVDIEIDDDGPDEPGEETMVTVVPSDTIAEIGSTIQFQAFFHNADTLIDTTATWSLAGMPIGTLSAEGSLTLDSVGFALVYAQVGPYSGSALVVATDSTSDSTGVTNSIVITRDSPNPQGYSVMDSLQEGEVWTIGGLSHPMNVLNGGGIYFPHGSLSEDIRIHISLPRFADTGGDSVNFGHSNVVTGIDFQVMVNDTISEPYYFETPLFVALPFKRGLIRHLGLDPLSLGLYFAVVDGDTVTFDSTGIAHTTVDSSRNRIFSSVAHFSSLVVKGSPTGATTVNEDNERIPTGYRLAQNYPNPFNPETNIAYTIPERANVQLTIFNSLGQRVATLVNKSQERGTYYMTWNGKNSGGQYVASGIYLYRLEAGAYSTMKKMVLLR